MSGRFYTSRYGTCDVCRKPATKEVRGPHNARYGSVCESKRCEKKRLESLEASHSQSSTFPRS